jgi:hypothetical protein
MRFEGTQLQKEFDEAFAKLGRLNKEIEISDLSPRQLWWLTKFAKHVRLRCRNNAAFNNYMNRSFPHAKFQEVQKERKDGTKYMGLQISVNGLSFEPEGEEDITG